MPFALAGAISFALVLGASHGKKKDPPAPPAPTAPAPAPVVSPPPLVEPGVHSYALIVANNFSSDSGTAPLHYADDDGARYSELLSLISDRVEILSVLDTDTQRIYPGVAASARPPTRKELQLTLDTLFSDIRHKAATGARTVFYFIYVGHGTVGDDGEGAMHLLDGRFTRADLYQTVIAKSPAQVNHVIIDACNAYLMVARRGDHNEAAINAAVQGFLSREGLDHYPNTGVLVSTSQASDVHEWSRFSAGIFSHEVRSALAGGADINGDGVVTYDEVHAFLAAANGQVSDPKAKLQAFISPPKMHNLEPLFDRKRVQAPSVFIPGTMAGRHFLEDARGVRYADLNLAKDGPVTMVLVPSPVYFLRSDRDDIEIPLAAAAIKSFDASTLGHRSSELAMRGSEALAFQRDLFAIPFGRAYFDGYVAHASDVTVYETPTTVEIRRHPPEGEPFPTHRYVSLGLGLGAVGAAAGGVFFGLSASSKASAYQSAIGNDTDVMQRRTDANNAALASNILYGVTGALVAGAVLLWFFPSDN
jgi:hypothetical protein